MEDPRHGARVNVMVRRSTPSQDHNKDEDEKAARGCTIILAVPFATAALASGFMAGKGILTTVQSGKMSDLPACSGAAFLASTFVAAVLAYAAVKAKYTSKINPPAP